jgi:multiple sugar transport system permease protein
MMKTNEVLQERAYNPVAAARPRQSLRVRILDGELGGYVLLAPAVIVLFLLTIWPLLYSIGISFTNYHLGSTSPLSFVGLSNFGHMVSDSIFLGSLVTTIELLALAIPLQLILGYVCARILQAAQGMPGARILRTCFIIPTMMTSLAVALFWGYILDPLIGVANWLLSLVHVAPQPWFTAPGSAFFTLTGVYLWQWVPFTSILLLAGLLNIPQPIYEAAAVDGVRWYNRVISIDIPLLLRVGAIAAILAVVEVIRLFDLVYGSTQGGPGTATLTNAVEIYRIGFEDFDTGYAAATSLIILVVTILIAQVFVRVLREEPGR